MAGTFKIYKLKTLATLKKNLLLTISVPRSMHKMVTEPRASGMSNKMKRRKGDTSGILEVNVYAIDFFKLSKINRPKKCNFTSNST
jgi:hypothetical protein